MAAWRALARPLWGKLWLDLGALQIRRLVLLVLLAALTLLVPLVLPRRRLVGLPVRLRQLVHLFVLRLVLFRQLVLVPRILRALSLSKRVARAHLVLVMRPVSYFFLMSTQWANLWATRPLLSLVLAATSPPRLHVLSLGRFCVALLARPPVWLVAAARGFLSQQGV
jgi:hypothetical protein